jgi:hypothetical protein
MVSGQVGTIQFRKRPWYTWAFRFVWFVWLVFWAEATIGSWKELERRAFVISLAIFALSLLLGAGLWFKGRLKSERNPRS